MLHINQRIVDKNDKMNGSYLGPQFKSDEIDSELKNAGAIFEKMSYEQIIEITAKKLSEGKAVGWMNGKMEFGPRALGNRSILADPRSQTMQKQLNLKIKYRESFRPFAPSVLNEYQSDWFTNDIPSPYMLFVNFIKKEKLLQLPSDYEDLFGIEKLNVNRSKVPAITHVDFSARIQSIYKSTNHKFHSLVKKFYDLTGCPMLVNTSFNIRGEPIVCAPIDAFNCFMGTELDILVIENFFLIKKNQNNKLTKDYKNKFKLD